MILAELPGGVNTTIRPIQAICQMGSAGIFYPISSIAFFMARIVTPQA